MEVSDISTVTNEFEELCTLVAYEEVASTKTKEQLIQEKLQELFDYTFDVPDRPEDDSSGKLAFLDACEQLHKASFMKFPIESITSRLLDDRESLDLGFFGLGRKGSIALAASLRVRFSISNLSLVGNHIKPAGAMEIARALSESRTVVTLDFSHNKLGARDVGSAVQGGAVVSELLKPGNVLKTLSLRDNGLDDQHIADFTDTAADNTELISLDLSFNSIGYLGAVEVATILSRNSDLREINLEWNKFQTMGSRHILSEGLLANNTIKRFNLSWNGLDDACAQLVGRIIGENAIEEIIIAHNRIGSSGAEAIAKGLTATSALTTLNMDDNPLQSEGCLALFRVVPEATTLKHLSLQHCRCSADAIGEAEKLTKEVRQDIVIHISEDCCSKQVM